MAILPQRSNERISRSLNFEGEFRAVRVVLGVTDDEERDLLADSAAMRYVILNSQIGSAFSKACTVFKNDMLGGVGENTDKPNVPVFSATPPSNDIETVEAGIIERLSKAMNVAKLRSGYTEAIGEALMIVTAPTDSAIPDGTKPSIKSTSMTGSIVRLDWVKGKFEGVFIDSKRNEETVWARLDFNMRSPFGDSRSPINSGKPEERRYRMRYFIDNIAVGTWSDTITVITLP